MGDGLISINDASKLRIAKLRQPTWANPFDHIEIHITPEGWLGPWVKLWSPINEAIHGRNPVQMIVTECKPDAKAFVPYTPPTTPGREEE